MRLEIKTIILGIAVASGICLLVVSSRVSGQDKKKPALATLSVDQLARAKSLFKEKCSRCHGLDGDGATTIGDMLDVPDFTNPKWWAKETTDARLVYSVTNGKHEMPAFGKKIMKSEIEWLIAYVRLFNKSADPKPSHK
jgi:mono/diheme cytochrome c family protein